MALRLIPGALPPGLAPPVREALALFDEPALAEALAFHRSLPEYRPTPLVPLPGLARRLGIRALLVKDESPRFGLGSVKALGSSVALHKLKGSFAGTAGEGGPVFVTATDGNHGKGLAWAAARLGCPAEIFMPAGSSPARVEAIRRINQTPVTLTDGNYMETVRAARRRVEDQNGGGLESGPYYLVQDTGFPGYQRTPGYVCRGYGTLAGETWAQLEEAGVPRPSHVFLQAGVGSLAAAVLACLLNRWPENPPAVIIVEPQEAACVFESVLAGGSEPVAVEGSPKTLMAGLNCGEVNPFLWPLLRDRGSFFAAVPDEITIRGMKLLARPFPGDPALVSGESGAVGTGLLAALALDPALGEEKKALGLDSSSVALVFSTEGATDPESYRRILETP
ncbi:MAG: diaminopropionate ammonia-lyase [Spirochaetales bacterium]|jgi:diaminopropionate ammonia-lyase|nr:diaminopropionate ammonia-lyase [Spirochaetales bacterium]